MNNYRLKSESEQVYDRISVGITAVAVWSFVCLILTFCGWIKGSVLLAKSATSCCFCLIAWLRYGMSSDKRVDQWLVSALSMSLLGDIALALNGDIFFLAGVGLFGLAHVCYLIAFWKINGSKMSLVNIAGAVCIFIGLIPVLFLSSLDYGTMFGPVIGYSCVISLMTGNALSVIYNRKYQNVGQWFIVGSFLFVVSDVILVCYLFDNTQVAVRQVVNWLFYYLAQFIFAFNVAGCEEK